MNETNANLHILSRKFFFQIQRQSMKIAQILRFSWYISLFIDSCTIQTKNEKKKPRIRRKKGRKSNHNNKVLPKLKLSGCLFHTHRRWDDFKYENLIIFSLDIEILWNGSCVVCHFISVSLFNFVILSFWRFSLGDTPRHDVFSYQFRGKTPAHNISLPIYTQQIIKYALYFLIVFGSGYIQYFAYGMECIQNSPCLILYYENKTVLAMKLFFFF